MKMLFNPIEQIKDLSLLAKHGYTIAWSYGVNNAISEFDSLVYVYGKEFLIYIDSTLIGVVMYSENGVFYNWYDTNFIRQCVTRKTFFNRLLWDKR